MPDRRAEAHLWRLLEESLDAVRRGTVEVWEAWRSYRAVADALVAIDAIGPEVADALVSELDDAFAVRGLVPAGAFSASPWPDVAVLTASHPAVGASASNWLEAEVERHLDLFVSFPVEAQARAAQDLLRILGGPIRAFAAVGALEDVNDDLLGVVAASLEAVGIDAGRAVPLATAAREDWVTFLRARPGPVPHPHEPDDVHRPGVTLGALGAWNVRVDSVAWSPEAVGLVVAVRSDGPRGGRNEARPWHVRAVDDRGHLHLGQPVVLRAGSGSLRVALRPGLSRDVRRLDVRVTLGGRRVEGVVAW